MDIDVVFAAGDLSQGKVKGKTAVVIDVLRATTVMVTALKNGAKEVVPVLSPKEAFALKKESPKTVILGGERDALPIEGFDYGNSPLDYTVDVISDKSLVMTTTNGTRAIKGALEADEILIGSFLNAKTVEGYITEKTNLVFVCSGSNDLFTIEDSLCAGLMISRLSKNNDVHLTDAALSMKVLYEANRETLQEIASQGSHYKLLQKRRFLNDLNYCFKKDQINVLPYYKDGRFVL